MERATLAYVNFRNSLVWSNITSSPLIRAFVCVQFNVLFSYLRTSRIQSCLHSNDVPDHYRPQLSASPDASQEPLRSIEGDGETTCCWKTANSRLHLGKDRFSYMFVNAEFSAYTQRHPGCLVKIIMTRSFLRLSGGPSRPRPPPVRSPRHTGHPSHASTHAAPAANAHLSSINSWMSC